MLHSVLLWLITRTRAARERDWGGYHYRRLSQNFRLATSPAREARGLSGAPERARGRARGGAARSGRMAES